MSDKPVILFLGASVTSGFGIPLKNAYPALIQSHINKAEINLKVLNAAVPGASTVDGLQQMRPYLESSSIKHLVIALGLADAVYRHSPDAIRRNIKSIVDEARKAQAGVNIYLFQSKVFQSFVRQQVSTDYLHEFEAIFPVIATAMNLTLLPFMLEGVTNKVELNQSDGIHPNIEGAKLIAESVWKNLSSHLR